MNQKNIGIARMNYRTFIAMLTAAASSTNHSSMERNTPQQQLYLVVGLQSSVAYLAESRGKPLNTDHDFRTLVEDIAQNKLTRTERITIAKIVDQGEQIAHYTADFNEDGFKRIQNGHYRPSLAVRMASEDRSVQAWSRDEQVVGVQNLFGAFAKTWLEYVREDDGQPRA